MVCTARFSKIKRNNKIFKLYKNSKKRQEGFRMSNTPEFEPWAIEGMAREGLTPEEYCNVHAYNWEDIMVEPTYDDDDD